MASERALELRDAAQRAREDADRLLREARALELAEEAARRPQEPSVGGAGDRAIVSFTRYQSGREYNYAALGWRMPGGSVRWVITGQETRRFNWKGLLDFIGEANWPSLHLMAEHRLLGPMPGQESGVAERMGAFGRVLGTEPTADTVTPLVEARVTDGAGRPRDDYPGSTGWYGS